MSGGGKIPAIVSEAVLVKTEGKALDTPTVSGYEFNNGINYPELFSSYMRTGFQATNLGLAIDEINKMLDWRLSDEPIEKDEQEYLTEESRSQVKCKIFFGYTSNLISSGLREMIRFLAEHKQVDVIVSTAGGIEEDFVKCLAPTHLGDFHLKGSDLRSKGINRIGNLLVPNDNYCLFEDWILPIFDQMLKEQKEDGVVWTPSSMIRRLGKEINDPRSVYYWCYKNDIPVYCPALTDGSIGDMLYFHSYKNPGLVLDIVGDIRNMNNEAVFAKRTGMLILGGGLVKHHIFNANLMRNGADHAVVVNLAGHYDGSDSGASMDEAVSWGKIRAQTKCVKVYAEVTLVFPIIMAETFAKRVVSEKKLGEGAEAEKKKE